MSRITQVASAGNATQFLQSIGYDNHVLSVQQYMDDEIQWWTEGDSAWKYISKFQDPTANLVYIDDNSSPSGTRALGVDYSRNIVFFGDSYGSIHSSSFDSDGVLTPIAVGATGLSYILQGKIVVDEVNKLLFVVGVGTGSRMFSFSYDEDGTNLTFLHQIVNYTSILDGKDLAIDTVKYFLFVADGDPSKGLSSFSYVPTGVNKGLMTYVNNYATSNHGYNSVEIDIVNQKLFAGHERDNTPTGVEILSYDNSAIISLVDTEPAPDFRWYGHVTVDLVRRLIFMSYTDMSYNARLASFSFDLSYNITALTNIVLSGTLANPVSIDTEKKYVFIALSNNWGANVSYNDAGTTLEEISVAGSGTGYNCVAIADHDFLIISSTNKIRSYTYDSLVERPWHSLCIFGGNLYGTAYGNLVRLDYVGPGWSTTKIADYQSSGIPEDHINSMTEYNGRIYGSGSGLLFRTNATFDGWELVAPIYIGSYWKQELTSFNGRLYATSGSRTYRLNLAGDSWEEVVGPTGGSDLRLGLHKNRLYMTASGGVTGYLYVLNDTEDDWVLLASGGSYVLSRPLSVNDFLYVSTYAAYGQSGQVYYLLESQSVIRCYGSPYGIPYPSPARYMHAPAELNGTAYFCGNALLFKLDLTYPCVTNMFHWDVDGYLYGWIGPGVGRYTGEIFGTEENLGIDAVYPARSADGITWNEIAMTELVGPQWDVERVTWSYPRGNYAPLSIWASFDGYLYSGANRLTEAVGSYATISRSSDGVNWTEVLYVSDFISTVRSLIVFHGNLYAAVEVNNTEFHTTSRIYRTSDGVAWDLIKTFDDGSGTYFIVNAFVEHNNQLYMTMRDFNIYYVYVSDDGINWANTQGCLGSDFVSRNNAGSIVNNGKVLFYASDTSY